MSEFATEGAVEDGGEDGVEFGGGFRLELPNRLQLFEDSDRPPLLFNARHRHFQL